MLRKQSVSEQETVKKRRQQMYTVIVNNCSDLNKTGFKTFRDAERYANQMGWTSDIYKDGVFVTRVTDKDHLIGW